MTSPLHRQMNEMLDSISTPALTDQIRFVVGDLVDTYRSNDIQRRVSLCHEDILFVDPVGLPVIHGREALGAFFSQCLEGGWSFSMEVDELVICANEALMTWTVSAQKRGAGSARIKASNMLAFTADGLIASWRAIFDHRRIWSQDVR